MGRKNLCCSCKGGNYFSVVYHLLSMVENHGLKGTSNCICEKPQRNHCFRWLYTFVDTFGLCRENPNPGRWARDWKRPLVTNRRSSPSRSSASSPTSSCSSGARPGRGPAGASLYPSCSNFPVWGESPLCNHWLMLSTAKCDRFSKVRIIADY